MAERVRVIFGGRPVGKSPVKEELKMVEEIKEPNISATGGVEINLPGQTVLLSGKEVLELAEFAFGMGVAVGVRKTFGGERPFMEQLLLDRARQRMPQSWY